MNPIHFRIINGALILATFISWFKIASLNWIVPEWVRTIWICMINAIDCNPNILQLNNMSINYILVNFIPFFAIFVISIIIFFIINTKNGTSNYFERTSMKTILCSVILSSILFIIVYTISYPPVVLPMMEGVYVVNWILIKFYFSCLCVIVLLLLCISFIGLLLLGELSKISRREWVTLRG